MDKARRRLSSFTYRALAAAEGVVVKGVRLNPSAPPLFIVGAPRSGTTLVYLHLINTFKVAYLPNLSKAHPRACISYAAFGKILHEYVPTYDSSYGIVAGPLAPSDGWDIFHRWFPRYDLSQPVKASRLYELRNIVSLMELVFRSPFMNKNNSNSLRLDNLNRLFPQAFFVHVDRDVTDTVRSLIEARRAHNVALNDWWGVPPPQFASSQFRSELEQCVCQVWGVNAHIRSSLEKISSDRWCAISYEDFCEQPDVIATWAGSRYAKASVSLARRRNRNQISFSPRIRTCPVGLEKQISDTLDRLENGWNPH